VLGLYSRAAAATAFARPEMLAIGFDTLRRWAAEDARLATYTHFFDQLERHQAHVRSTEVEELLGRVQESFNSAADIHGVLTDADLRFAPARPAEGDTIDLAQGNVNALLANPDREVRRTAWTNYADAHLAHKNTMAACLATGVKQNVFMARARRYGSALEAALDGSDLPLEVFHNLIETFRRHLPTWHRYWRLRREALGYEQLHVYDIKAPLTRAMPEVPFERAVEWISAGMRPLGDEYVAVMRRGLNEQRWVDIYPNKGKRMGAYSHGYPGTHPFILMSYNDDIFSMSTLAHELGHSMHSYYSWQTQPQIYSDYSTFVAEVASNFNQALTRAHLLETSADPDFQIAVIEEAMSNFHRYFFIMPTLARFELAIHERVERGQALTAEAMITLMADLFQEGFGDEVAVDRERVGITWGQFSTHLYSNFYVFQYATGISAAHALAAGVLEGRPEAAARYLKFLQTGGSLYPIDALKLAGVDMTSPEAVETTFATLASYVDRLAELVKSGQ
jgi:oligoendopeptidase F